MLKKLVEVDVKILLESLGKSEGSDCMKDKQKKENQLWHSYYSSPKTIALNQEFWKSRSIVDLIKLRDSYYDIIKKEEGKDYFFKWNPNCKSEEFDIYLFKYEDALDKVAFTCSIIDQKRKSMFMYCEDSPKREYYHGFADRIYDLIMENPYITYSDIINQVGEDSQFALDFLIEEQKIERIGEIDSNYWKVLQIQSSDKK